MRGKTERGKPFRYLAGVILGVLMTSGLVLYLSRGDSSATKTGAAYQTARAFKGDKFEASGVTHVPGIDGIFFVDDGRPGEVLWMQVDRDGNQIGPIKAIKLGVKIEDPEGITTDGSHIYLVSSQSKSKDDEGVGIVRFKFDPNSQSVETVETASDLRRFLVENVIELRDMGAKKARDDGMNIEGLAWDPDGGRLLLGLRSPVIDGHALLAPLKLRDPKAAFSLENLEASAAIRLPLGGQGIRSIEYDDQSKLFHIIAGATENQEKTDFKLWEWGGGADRAALREVATFDRKLKPEGITRATVGDSSFKIVVFDSSRYLKIDLQGEQTGLTGYRTK